MHAASKRIKVNSNISRAIKWILSKWTIPTFDPINPVASRFIPHDNVGTPNDVERAADGFRGKWLTSVKICTVNNKAAR